MSKEAKMKKKNIEEDMDKGQQKETVFLSWLNKITYLDNQEKWYNTKNSLRLRMTLIMTTIVVTIILLCWGINRLFLEKYYEHIKKDTLLTEAKQLNTEFTETQVNMLRKYNLNDGYITSNSSISVEDGIKISAFLNDIKQRNTNNNMLVFVFGLADDGSYDRLYASMDQPVNINRKLFQKLNKNEYQLLEQTGYNEEKNMILIGRMDSGAYVFIMIGFKSIHDSVEIANKFLAYIGLAVTIIASILVFFISKSISKPILELSDIAKKMAGLDFDVRYQVSSKDEIGVLGNSINFLSEKLKGTVSELKTANIELLKDIELKQKTDNMRKEFLSNISHELKTPIALIQGYAEGLKDNIHDDEDSKEFYCEVIVDESRKMNNLVMKILDLNHIEFGDSPVTFSRFNMVELIQAVTNSTDILFQQKEAKLIFDEKEPIYVWADEFMTEEVLTNYISNALNHVDGEKVIRINLTRKEELLRISVFNTGEQIPEEDIERIWEKFYKVDKARTREYGGSGVGLSIVKAIMDSHGRGYGAINHEDGVEFWFELDMKSC